MADDRTTPRTPDGLPDVDAVASATAPAPAWLRKLAPAWRVLRVVLDCIPPLAALAVALGLVHSIYTSIRNTAWCYYTDDVTLREDHEGSQVRRILWEDPYPAYGALTLPGAVREPAFFAGETVMVFSRGLGTASNANLYTSTWDGRLWAEPQPLNALNSVANDTGPAPAHDGKRLYFASDRAGGSGGFDIWVSSWDGFDWSSPTNLGPEVNSPHDDISPALSHDGRRLFFASNRPMKTGGKAADYDIYQAIAPTGAVPQGAVSPPFATAARVDILCSGADDLHPDLTARGDAVYFASGRRGGLGGLDLYAARMLGDEVFEPRNLGIEINTDADDTEPAIRWEGFDMYFCSARDAADGNQQRLHRSTAREVVGEWDLSRWYRLLALLGRVKWWIIIALAALWLLVYLVKHFRDLTNLFHKCLLGSLILHIVAVLLMAFWFISQEFIESMESKEIEMSIDVDNLAKEKLALDMEDDVTELPKMDQTLLTEPTPDDLPVPKFTPPRPTDLPPLVTRSSDQSFVQNVTPSKARPDQEVQQREMTELKDLDDLPPLDLPQLDIKLEEVTVEVRPEDVPETPADDTPIAEVVFDPFAVQQTQEPITVKPQDYRPAASRILRQPARAEDVAVTGGAVRDTGGTTVVPSAGLEPLGMPPPLTGIGDLAKLMIKSDGPGTRLRINAPGKLDVPEGVGDSLSPHTFKNAGGLSDEMIASLGGSADTQNSIARALDWFTQNQEPDGRWDIEKHGGDKGHDVAATSLILLCYYGWGARHTVEGPHQDAVKRALEWLVKQEDKRAYYGSKASNGMYDHGMAAIALCEAYGLTKDEQLLKPSQRAIDLIIDAQHENGGWRYTPNANDSDTSVFGWQYMALRSAQLAGLDVPEKVLKKADKWIESVSGGKHGGIVGYQRSETSRPAMIATGMFCRQLAGKPPTDPEMMEAAQYLRGNMISEKNVDFYLLYYGALCLYQHQGPIWEEWNKNMKSVLLSRQHKTGPHAGSWDAAGRHSSRMGRTVGTAIATLSLEVYYRMLPIYGFRMEPETPPGDGGAATAPTD